MMRELIFNDKQEDMSVNFFTIINKAIKPQGQENGTNKSPISQIARNNISKPILEQNYNSVEKALDNNKVSGHLWFKGGVAKTAGQDLKIELARKEENDLKIKKNNFYLKNPRTLIYNRPSNIKEGEKYLTGELDYENTLEYIDSSNIEQINRTPMLKHAKYRLACAAIKHNRNFGFGHFTLDRYIPNNVKVFNISDSDIATKTTKSGAASLEEVKNPNSAASMIVIYELEE